MKKYFHAERIAADRGEIMAPRRSFHDRRYCKDSAVGDRNPNRGAGRQVRSLDTPGRVAEADASDAADDRLFEHPLAADELLAAPVERRLVPGLLPAAVDELAGEGRGDEDAGEDEELSRERKARRRHHDEADD